MPWNFPHDHLARVIAPNLLLGNTVMFKHASICRASAEMVERMVLDRDAPEGVVIHDPLSHAQVEEVGAHPAIAGISFTGGDAAGAVIAQIARKHLKKSVLGPGGSDPFIAFDITDVEETASSRLACVMPTLDRRVLHRSGSWSIIRSLTGSLRRIEEQS